MPKDSAQNVMSVNTPEDSTLKRQLPDSISDTPDSSPKRSKVITSCKDNWPKAVTEAVFTVEASI